MAELIIKKEDAKRLYPTADKTMKEIFEQTFGKETFNGNIMDRIKNISDIYEEMGINEAKFKRDIPYRAEKMAHIGLKIGLAEDDIEEGVPCFSMREFNVYAIAFVLNEGWYPTKSDKRWYPSFSLSSGFAFSYSNYVNSYSYADSGFRLCLKSEKLADFAGKTFPKEFEKFFM